MSRIEYVPKNFSAGSLEVIEQANAIIAAYKADGLDLTLRQLYYQFVARDLLANNNANYKRLGSIVNDARLAGMIDWNTIVDRTRTLYGPTHYDDPADAILDVVERFKIDLWQGQPHRVEVWVEKEALAGVIGRACEPLDLDYFPCRGYVSQSAQWRAAMRLAKYQRDGQAPIIIHLGDHDPSGIDMSRDILDRVSLFMQAHGLEPATVERIALNMDQVRQYNPPPNPAKLTDSRAGDYLDKFGKQSWELDALDPGVLVKLIRDKVETYLDRDLFESRQAEQETGRVQLKAISDNYGDVVDYLDNLED